MIQMSRIHEHLLVLRFLSTPSKKVFFIVQKRCKIQVCVKLINGKNMFITASQQTKSKQQNDTQKLQTNGPPHEQHVIKSH